MLPPLPSPCRDYLRRSLGADIASSFK
jgi:hypothetical protein